MTENRRRYAPWLALAVLALGLFMTLLDLTIVNVLPDAVAAAIWSAETTAAAIGQVHGVRIRQRLGKLHVALARLHRTVQDDHARAAAELTVADRGAVFRDGGAGDALQRGDGRLKLDVGGRHRLSPPLPASRVS